MNFLKKITGVIVLFSFFTCQPADDKDEKGVQTPINEGPHPNILLIMTDDQGWGDLHFHGNDSISTPNLDRLAEQSIRFDHFYVSPFCSATRASLLTGRYHLRTGTSWVTHRKEVMRSEEMTLAELFKGAGYTTGLFGKWHNGEQFPNDPRGQGFDEFFGFTAGHWNNYFNATLRHNDEEVPTEGFITDVLTDQAIGFIEKNKETPFLCYVPYNAPHSPFQMPDRYFDKYKKKGLTDKNAAVYGMIENVDDNIGRLLATLDTLGIAENTIVVFLSDNGPNGQRFNGGMQGIKGSVHEGGVRVPFFIRWKNNPVPNSLRDREAIPNIAAHIDLLPTLADLCNVTLPARSTSGELDGRSLVPLLKNPAADWPSRLIFNIHTEGEMRMKPAAVRNDRYRLVVDQNDKIQLFDLKEDPGERRDIAGNMPELRDSLYGALTDWFKDVTAGGIQPPPVPVAASHVSLPAPEARFRNTSGGCTRFKGGIGWANDYIVNWEYQDDGVEWDINVDSAGLYEIFLLCHQRQFGLATIVVEAAGVPWEMHLRGDFLPDPLPSPDRVPRDEVYESKWLRLKVGEVKFAPGPQTVKVSLKNTAAEEGVFELKGCELIKVDPEKK